MKDIINRKWAVITQINREFDELYHKIAVYYNLSDSSFWVLYILYEAKRPLSQKEICDYWCYNKQTINSAIKHLEKIGYINKGYEENNKMNKKIGLTPKGLKVAEKSVKKVIEIEDKTFASVNEKDLDKIIELMQKPLTAFKDEINKVIK